MGAFSQLIVFFLMATVVAIILVVLFRLRFRFGLTPLYVTLGVFQPLQILLASSIYAEILPGIIVSPGSVIMFTANLFAILLIYIREDAQEARTIIFGIILANLALSGLMLLFAWQTQLSGTLNFLNLPPGLFNQSVRITLSGTFALFADILLIIFVYEAVWRFISKYKLLCIYLTVALILIVDTLIFATGAFWGQANYASILYSGIIGKLLMAIPYTLIVTTHLRFGETDQRKPHSFEDIFNTLSYIQKYHLAEDRSKQLANIVDNAEQPVGVGYPDGRLGLCNPAFCQLTGYTMEELQAIDWNTVLTPSKWLEAEYAILSQLEATSKPIRYEKEYIHKDGTCVPIELLVHLVRDQDGLPRYYYAFVTDITERKKTEKELKKYRDHLEELAEKRAVALLDLSQFNNIILDTVPVGIMTYGADGNCVSANVSAGQLIGATHEQVLAQNFNNIVSWQEIGLFDDACRCLETGEPQQRTASFTTSSGKKIVVDLQFTRFMVQEEPHLLLTFTDITDRVLAEEALRISSNQLKATNRELEVFAYSVSHDLRTPLRSIDGFSKALLEDYGDILDEKGHDHLHRVRAAAQRMGQMIADLLELSRISRWQLEQKSVNLGVLAAKVIVNMRAQEPERDVDVVIGDGLNIEGDPRLIRLIMENLIGNAWKFSRKASKACIEVGRTRNADLTQPNETLSDDALVFYVRDNGAGFNMAYADKLFGAFQRLHTVSEFEGTGIGLATVTRAVQRQGGLVWAKGQVDKGATFYFTLKS